MEKLSNMLMSSSVDIEILQPHELTQRRSTIKVVIFTRNVFYATKIAYTSSHHSHETELLI